MRQGTQNLRGRPPLTQAAKVASLRRYAPVALITLIAVAVLTAFGVEFYQFSKDFEKYSGIRISDDRNEVLYRLGFPPEVLDDSQKNSSYAGRRSYKTNRKTAGDDPDKIMPEGKTVADYYEWSYPAKGVFIDFDRVTKGIEHIDCIEYSDAQHLCAPLVGIGVGDSEDHVKDKLGKPDRDDLDGVTKTMSYDGVGVEFRLTKGSVYYLRLSRAEKRSQIELLYIYLRGVFT